MTPQLLARVQAKACFGWALLIVTAGWGVVFAMELVRAYDLVTPVSDALSVLIFQGTLWLLFCVAGAAMFWLGVWMESSESRDRERSKDVENARLRARNEHMTWVVASLGVPTERDSALDAPVERISVAERVKWTPPGPDWLDEPYINDTYRDDDLSLESVS